MEMLFVIFLFRAISATALVSAPLSALSTLVPEKAYEQALHQREVIVNASLDENRYRFYALMKVNALIERTKKTLLDEKLYLNGIPFVKEVKVNSDHSRYQIRGGVFGYELSSTLLMKSTSENKIEFEFVEGHFVGMKGSFRLEKTPDFQTLVFLSGEHNQPSFPPKLVMVQGAEMVLTFTGRKMRSIIESFLETEAKSNDDNLPRPKRNFK